MSARSGDFMWGAVSSAFVVEGGNFNSDWWRWEQRPGRIRDGSTSKVAADHYGRYEEDFGLARKLGHKAHLFVLEWSRIEPEQGWYNDTAIEHYGEVFDVLEREGLEPVCALHHGSNPAWLDKLGGWGSGKAARAFERYAQRVADAFAARCRWWIPILEPMHTVEMSNLEGLWPPGRGRLLEAPQAFRNTIQAHAFAYRALHERRPDALVGASTRGRWFRPYNEHSAWDFRAAERENERCNRWTFDAVTSGGWPRIGVGAPDGARETADFLAFSYFGEEIVRFSVFHPGRRFAQPVDETGRPIGGVLPAPYAVAGFRELINTFSRYRLPLLVSGNGIATENDEARCRFLREYIPAVLEAVESGVDLRGYFHYALLDGFEWTEGYEARYGLIHVDVASQARTPNPSAWMYKDICETGRISGKFRGNPGDGESKP